MNDVSRIDIFYYSGTGNTAWVVHRLAKRLVELGDQVRATSCEDISPCAVDPAACDVMGLALPIYSSFAPRVMGEFLRALPPGGDKPLFAVASAGYVAGDVCWYATKSLRAKGYDPFLYGNVIMPNNFFIPPMAILPVTPPERVPAVLGRAERKIGRLADFIHRREMHLEGIGVLGRLVGILQRMAGEGFETRFFGPFFADHDCTLCGWCVEHCPVGNIEMGQDGPRFLDHCMLCLRCYSFCPVQAVQATERTRNAQKFRRYAGPENKRYSL
jgi:ferredoxin/flavodoxin